MSVTITAAMVKDLRERTGAGMMECKTALSENGGELEQAVAWLRRKGAAGADRKAGRTAAEGVVCTQLADNSRRGIVLEVNCETDFVARDETFRAFAAQAAATALAHEADSVETLSALTVVGDGGGTVEEARLALVAKVGENIRLRRFTIMQEENCAVAEYNHGGRIGVLVAVGGNADGGRDIAMHIAASAPLCVSEEDLPADVVAREKEIFAAQAADSGKPPHIAEKMAGGKLRKFIAENTLLGQPFVKKPDQSVADFLRAGKMTVAKFARYQVGEGLEKRRDDFAADVMAQAGRG